MDDDLLHSFDDWELRAEEDKGKRPLEVEEEEEDYASSDSEGESDAEPEEEADEQAGQQLQLPQAGDNAAATAATVEEATPGAAEPPLSPRCDSEPGDLTCAICLGGIPLENLAMVKGCDHMYCATCILHWALHKEEPWCPQCKHPFSYLLTYRTLDGTLQDFPTEESVCLLKRARWFEEHLRFVDAGGASTSLLEESRLADQMAWQEYGGEYDLAEDEEIESFYFSSAAGRARVLLGNRRHGEGGFISAGRRQARPTPEQRGKQNGGGKAGGSKAGKAAAVRGAAGGMPPVPQAAASSSFNTPNAGGGRKARPGSAVSGAAAGSTPVPMAGGSMAGAADLFASGSPSGSAGGSGLYGSSPSGSGRRARRNARRTAMDSGIDSVVGGWGRD